MHATVICVLLFALALRSCFAVSLDEKSEEYVKQIIAKFLENPTDPMYDHIVYPPFMQSDMPAVFVWSPADHYSLQINCPLHNVPLVPSIWTDCLEKDKSPRNPRLIYHVRGNALLLQRYYKCKFRHQLLSASQDIMSILPPFVSDLCFPFHLHHRTVFSNNLVDYIYEQVAQGMSFALITEGIANLNYEEYMRRFLALTTVNPNAVWPYHDNVMFSFASEDKIVHLFLDVFRNRQRSYEDAMLRIIPQRCISTDTTFPVRNIRSAMHNDKKTVREFAKLYVVMDEKHQIVAWQLMKSDSVDEVRDLLAGLSNRILLSSGSIDTVLVENCFQELFLYQTLFGEIPIFMDLSTAFRRISNILNVEKSPQYSAFMKDLTMIFRERTDLEEARTQPTADGASIESNLDRFLLKHSSFVGSQSEDTQSNLMKEFQNIRLHISNGYCSGIPAECETNGNKLLHKMLERSILRSAFTVGPELAIAILTVLFYAYNSKVGGQKHTCNTKITPRRPLQVNLEEKQSKLAIEVLKAQKETEDQISGKDLALQEIGSFEALRDITVIQFAVQSISTIYLSLSILQEQCVRRGFDAVSTLLLTMGYADALAQPLVDRSETQHNDTLMQNLHAFGLEMDFVEPDGDCAFRSLLLQINKLFNEDDDNELEKLTEHLAQLGLDSDDDIELIMKLREVFVMNMRENEKYSQFILDSDWGVIEQHLQRGVFASNIGDFIIDVCSDILKVPVVVISSVADMSVYTHIPDDPVVSNTVFIAYNAYGCGHYSGTRKWKDDTADEVAEDAISCKCDRRDPSGSDLASSCVQVFAGGYPNRCPCRKAGQPCGRQCRCKRCGNEDPAAAPVLLFCRCGTGKTKTDTQYKSCCDAPDQPRRTKCPCFGSKKMCSEECLCYNCNNMFGPRVLPPKEDGKPLKKRRRAQTPGKKLKSSIFMAQTGYNAMQGSWTSLETIGLFVCAELLSRTSLAPAVEHIHDLYTLVSASHVSKETGIALRPKSLQDVIDKLDMLKKKSR